MGHLAGLLAREEELGQVSAVLVTRELTESERRILPLVQAAAVEHRVEPALILAHVARESSFNPRATHRDVNGKSSYGLMQLRLATAREVAQDPSLPAEALFDPALNVRLGTRYIAKNLARYGGSYPDAIAAYNAGTARKDALGRYVNSRGVPNVQAYVDGVVAALGVYREGRSGLRAQGPTVGPWALAGLGLLGLGLAVALVRE